MKWLLRITILVKLALFASFNVVAIVVLLTCLLLFSHTGNVYLLDLAQRIEPRLTVELEQGVITNVPVFKTLSWQDQQTQITLDDFSYKIDWSCLLSKVCLQHVDIGSATLNVQQTQQATVANEPAAVLDTLPIDFAIDDFTSNNISFVVNEMSGKVEHLHFSATGENQQIQISAAIAGLLVALPEPKTPGSEPAKFDFSVPIINQQHLVEINLPFNIVLKPFTVSDLTLLSGNSTLLQVNDFSIESEFVNSQLQIKSSAVDLPETNVQLAGQINFSGKYPLNLQIQGDLKNIEQLQPSDLLFGQHYDLKVSGDLGKLNSELRLSKKMAISLASENNLLAKNFPHKLHIAWQSLRWPLTGEPQYQSTQGQLHTSGSSDNYQLSLSSDYQLAGYPAGDISLKGQGNLQQFTVEQLVSNVLDGQLNLHGTLSWLDTINWSGQLSADNIDTASVDPLYPGKLSGLVEHSVLINPNYAQPQWQFNVSNMNINGELLQHPLAVTGKLHGDSRNGITLSKVTLTNAQSRVSLDGILGKQNNLAMAVDITNLGHLLPAASGTIYGSVLLQGQQQDAHISIDLSADNLAYQSHKIESVKLASDITLADTPIVDLQLKVQHIDSNGQKIEQLQANVKTSNIDNKPVTHRIDLSVVEADNSADIELELSKIKQAWLTNLTAFNIHFSDYLIILNEPLKVAFANNNLVIPAHCWQISTPDSSNSENAQLCAAAINLAEQKSADLTLKDFPMASLNRFLTQPVTLDGILNGSASIDWAELNNPMFDINIASKAMAVSIKQKNKIRSYPIDTFAIHLLNEGQSSKVHVTVSAAELVSSTIDAQISPDWQQVSAKVDFALPDLSPLMIFSGQLEKLSGAINGQLALTGPLTKPVIDGQINITYSSIYAVDLPLKISNFNSKILINNNNAQLEGEFTSEKYSGYNATNTVLTKAISLVDKSVQSVGNVITQTANTDSLANGVGKASIKGSFNWNKQLRGDLYLSGNKITINDYQKLNLQVSPELHLRVADSLQLTGNIMVDQGVITVNKLEEGGVAVSKDVIVVDSETIEKGGNIPLAMDLLVDLGKQLQIKALGLDAIITGQLQVKRAKDSNLNIYGTLALSGGTYTALSQKLTLQDSEIIFQGPVATPYISITANRDPANTSDDVTAGVKITGSPDNLELNVYSDPEMSQQEALSYLLQGQSLENSSGSSSQVTSMLVILQLTTGSSFAVLNKFGSQLGIENLSLAASGSGDEQTVGLTGYIAPRVEISYGLGVFDNFSRFAIRYEMFANFYIEASTGLSQAIDVYYQFDWD